MKATIFYSWQSDLPSGENRNFIEDAVKRALKSINKDQLAMIESVFDRDTKDSFGSPDISQTIFSKIAQATIFIADVSIVNTTRGPSDRAMPNPNVLIELGYAVAELGWSKVIIVMNNKYGGPEALPFDLRSRRVVAYSPEEFKTKSESRGALVGRLEAELRNSLEVGDYLMNLPSGFGAKLWWGKWWFNYGNYVGGQLLIREVSHAGFHFNLITNNGSHSGNINGFAKIISPDLAYCKVNNGDDYAHGEIEFRRDAIDGVRIIKVSEIQPCSYHRGARASFDGRFVGGPLPWFDAGYLNEVELARIFGVVGNYFWKMVECAMVLHPPELVEGGDDWIFGKCLTGGVAGLYTIMESIIILSESGEVWVAFIDSDVDSIRYFTNNPDWKEKLPKIIINWMSNFSHKPVLMDSAISFVEKID